MGRLPLRDRALHLSCGLLCSGSIVTNLRGTDFLHLLQDPHVFALQFHKPSHDLLLFVAQTGLQGSKRLVAQSGTNIKKPRAYTAFTAIALWTVRYLYTICTRGSHLGKNIKYQITWYTLLLFFKKSGRSTCNQFYMA